MFLGKPVSWKIKAVKVISKTHSHRKIITKHTGFCWKTNFRPIICLNEENLLVFWLVKTNLFV